MILGLNYEFRTKVMKIRSLNEMLSCSGFLGFFFIVFKTIQNFFRYILSYFYRFVNIAISYNHGLCLETISNLDDSLGNSGDLNPNTMPWVYNSKGCHGECGAHENYTNESVLKQ